MKRKLLLLLIFSSLLACGKSNYDQPDLGGLYNKSARRSHDQGNAVIVIPGILGSKLRDADSGQLVWGAFEKSTANPSSPEGARLVAVPMEKGVPIDELLDNVHSDGALDTVKVSLLGLPIELNAYINILSTLGAGGYLDDQLASNEANQIDYGEDHFTCFQFDYDWRLDNVENAKRLNDFIEKQRAYILEEYESSGHPREDVKFDIVAHSMGGLLTRYLLRYGPNDLPEDGSVPEVTWEGAEHIDKVIIIGTPNAGAVGAVENLFVGRDFGPFLPKYEPAVIGTMPSLYQQLPRVRHRAILDENRNPVDIMNADLWVENGWGLADPNQAHVLKWLLPDVSDPDERREIAIDHLRKSLKRGKQFQDAIDQPATPPDSLRLYLLAGDAIPTGSGVTINSTKEHFEVTDYEPGDGTVARYSALMDERMGQYWTPQLKSPIKWTNVMFLFTDHLGLTKDPAFSDNVLYLLLEQPSN